MQIAKSTRLSTFGVAPIVAGVILVQQLRDFLHQDALVATVFLFPSSWNCTMQPIGGGDRCKMICWTCVAASKTSRRQTFSDSC